MARSRARRRVARGVGGMKRRAPGRVRRMGSVRKGVRLGYKSWGRR